MIKSTYGIEDRGQQKDHSSGRPEAHPSSISRKYSTSQQPKLAANMPKNSSQSRQLRRLAKASLVDGHQDCRFLAHAGFNLAGVNLTWGRGRDSSADHLNGH